MQALEVVQLVHVDARARTHARTHTHLICGLLGGQIEIVGCLLATTSSIELFKETSQLCQDAL